MKTSHKALSARSSQAAEDSTSVSNRPDGTSNGDAKSTSIAAPSSTAAGPTYQFTPTFVPLDEWSPCTCSLADSPAKTSARPGPGKDSPASAPGSGMPWQTPFARYVPGSSSSRTSLASSPRWVDAQESLLSEPCSPTWPKQGTWDLGYAYELPTLAPPTDANASSSLLPTPGANDSTGGEVPTRLARQTDGDTGGPSLRDINHLLPTPTHQDGKNNAGPSQWERNSDPLNVVAAKLLPTPTEGDGKASGSRNLEGSQAHAGVSLTDAVKFGNSNTPRTGDSMPAPSTAGNEPSDEPLPGQLTIGDA